MSRGRHSIAAQSDSTQVRHPWRAAARTGLAAGLAALLAFPDIARVLDITHLPGVATVIAVAVATTRVLALPSVEKWIGTYVPFLATEPPEPDPDDDARHER